MVVGWKYVDKGAANHVARPVAAVEDSEEPVGGAEKPARVLDMAVN